MFHRIGTEWIAASRFACLATINPYHAAPPSCVERDCNGKDVEPSRAASRDSTR